MTAIYGLLHRSGGVIERPLLRAMSARLAHRGALGTDWCDPAGAVALGARVPVSPWFATPAAAPRVHADSGMVLVADARIDNRRELARDLGLERGREIADTDLILAAYRRWGRECATHLIGDFAFALWDPRQRTLFCARDPMGVKPLYYWASRAGFAFATEIKALLALPGVSAEVDAEQIAIYLAWAQPPRGRTLYRDIQRLPAAHTLTVAPDAEPALRRYWNPGEAAVERLSTADQYRERFVELFRESVRCRLPEAMPVATALSGGLDSSAITCTARDLRHDARDPGDIHALSLVFPELPESDLRLIDERAFIDRVLARGGVRGHAVRGDLLSPLGAADRVMWHLDLPFAAPNLYLHWGMYAAARDAGAAVFLDGLDGDTTVSHGLGRLAGMLRSGAWDTFEHEVRRFAQRQSRQATSVAAYFAMPYLRELTGLHAWHRWVRTVRQLRSRFGISGRSLVKEGLLAALPDRLRAVLDPEARTGAIQLLLPHLGRAVGAWEREASAEAPATERDFHLAALTQPAYQCTLEMADACAAAFGVEPRYPFFDRRLIEFCLSVPDEMKLSDGWGRLIFREAMEGILPPEVQWRNTKANLAPNFQRRFAAVDRRLVEETDFAPLSAYVRTGSLARLRERYFAEPRGWGDPDSYLLLRAVTLSRWLRGLRVSGDSAPAAEARAA